MTWRVANAAVFGGPPPEYRGSRNPPPRFIRNVGRLEYRMPSGALIGGSFLRTWNAFAVDRATRNDR